MGPSHTQHFCTTIAKFADYTLYCCRHHSRQASRGERHTHAAVSGFAIGYLKRHRAGRELPSTRGVASIENRFLVLLDRDVDKEALNALLRQLGRVTNFSLQQPPGNDPASPVRSCRRPFSGSRGMGDWTGGMTYVAYICSRMCLSVVLGECCGGFF